MCAFRRSAQGSTGQGAALKSRRNGRLTESDKLMFEYEYSGDSIDPAAVVQFQVQRAPATYALRWNLNRVRQMTFFSSNFPLPSLFK